jgi:thiol-disulfide isomerase/thioredoxin
MQIILALSFLLSSFHEARSLQSHRELSRDPYGTQAPEFRARSIDGKEYRLSSFRGRYVLLDFWAVSCPPCRDAMPALEAIHHEYKDRGLLIIGIDVGEERSKVKAFLQKAPAPYATLVDTASDVAKLFHVDSFPTFMLIDPDGKIVDTRVGFLKAGPNSHDNIGECQLRGMLLERMSGNDFAK